MATTSADAGLPKSTAGTQSQWLVIGASSLGTVFEWYDFYLYGLLTSVISSQFFSGVNEVTGFIFALAAFGAGFAVRPFGALVFGFAPRTDGTGRLNLTLQGVLGVSLPLTDRVRLSIAGEVPWTYYDRHLLGVTALTGISIRL